jgi:hypothetical protein
MRDEAKLKKPNRPSRPFKRVHGTELDRQMLELLPRMIELFEREKSIYTVARILNLEGNRTDYRRVKIYLEDAGVDTTQTVRVNKCKIVGKYSHLK